MTMAYKYMCTTGCRAVCGSAIAAAHMRTDTSWQHCVSVHEEIFSSKSLQTGKPVSSLQVVHVSLHLQVKPGIVGRRVIIAAMAMAHAQGHWLKRDLRRVDFLRSEHIRICYGTSSPAGPKVFSAVCSGSNNLHITVRKLCVWSQSL